ncbi:probable WRKY transcription factor 70 isoform X3 [Setaria italica]|uniref:probable WRKY transcription factor 70 isoform X3 n=1 Tax=Setaria italica TaxID=4555 RepID=UPI000BE59035|nr:probable WRKY transcription factor 70 isoform X3 [Setaria italica]XP_022682407.1 probable WRKY transcription factor 70 isoform X3 [Setaria italica]
MKEIATGQSLVTQLRAIVLPALQAYQRCELAAQMFQNILDCSSKAITELQFHHQSDARADDALVDDKKRVRRISSDDCINEEGGTANPHHQHKRSRKSDDSVSLETPVPRYDGRQWRKYGQKHINKAKHPRSYYRCTYRQEQGCKATKTVQQKDDSTEPHWTNIRAGAGPTPPVLVILFRKQDVCCGHWSGDRVLHSAARKVVGRWDIWTANCALAR